MYCCGAFLWCIFTWVVQLPAVTYNIARHILSVLTSTFNYLANITMPASLSTSQGNCVVMHVFLSLWSHQTNPPAKIAVGLYNPWNFISLFQSEFPAPSYHACFSVGNLFRLSSLSAPPPSLKYRDYIYSQFHHFLTRILNHSSSVQLVFSNTSIVFISLKYNICFILFKSSRSIYSYVLFIYSGTWKMN